MKVTMQAGEEMRNPVRAEYYGLLEKKMEEGVQIIRVGFGSPAEFTVLMAQRPYIHSHHPNYTFRRVNNVGYQRMLMVDDSRMMFRVYEQDIPRVYYTEDEETIRQYLDSFSTHFKDSV